jgi:hypothetical protein
MPRAISSTAIAPSACASRIKDDRAKNSTRPRRGCSIRSIRAGFELVGARLITAHPITEVVGAALGFSRSRGRYNAGRTAQNQRANVGSQPHRRRADFFRPTARGHSCSLPSKAWQHPSLRAHRSTNSTCQLGYSGAKAFPHARFRLWVRPFLLAFSTLALKVRNPRHV